MFVPRTFVSRLGTALLLGTLAAACGGSDTSTKEKPSNPAAGAYDATVIVTKSTDKNTKTGEASKASTLMFFTCADEPCKSLYQRGFEYGQSTILLTPTADGYSGTKTTTGFCQGTTGPKYTSTTDYTWKRAEDGTMTALRTDRVTGCQSVSSEARWTATPNTQVAIPYLSNKAQATTIIDAYGNFGTAFAEFTTEYGKCEKTDPGTVSTSESACMGSAYQQYADALTALGGSVKTVPVDAGTACAKAIANFKYGELAAKYDQAGRLLIGAKTGPDIDEGFAALNKLVAFDSEQTEYMRSVALMCTEPADAKLFGNDGVLNVDPGSLLRAEGNA